MILTRLQRIWLATTILIAVVLLVLGVQGVKAPSVRAPVIVQAQTAVNHVVLVHTVTYAGAVILIGIALAIAIPGKR
jgi:hypothetical protein